MYWIVNGNYFVTDVEQEKLIKLLSNLKEDNLVNGNSVQDSFKSLCHVLDERENEIEKVITSASILFATAICEHLVPLSDVATLTDNGAHYPLFLLVLQHVHKKKGKSELSEIFNKSKVNFFVQYIMCVNFVYIKLDKHADLLLNEWDLSRTFGCWDYT